MHTKNGNSFTVLHQLNENDYVHALNETGGFVHSDKITRSILYDYKCKEKLQEDIG